MQLTHEQRIKKELEESDKAFKEFLTDLQRDCYKELWEIVDINKVVSDPKQKQKILNELRL